MLKAAFWCSLAMALVPLAILLMVGAMTLSSERIVERQMEKTYPPTNDVHFHERCIGVGPFRMEWHPRAWALSLAGAGAVLIVLAYAYILHIPAN